VGVLGVKTLNLQIVYDKLLRETPDTPMEYVKNTVMTFNSLLESDATDNSPDLKRQLDLALLLKAAAFLVRYPNGDKALVSGEVSLPS